MVDLAGRNGKGDYSSLPTTTTTTSGTNRGGRNKMKSSKIAKSPFFRPSDPRTLHPVSTPGGTVRMEKRKDEGEHKSTIFGAWSNLVVSIVGAGIIGIPYAIKEAGLVSGVIMVLVVAMVTEKSLRILIETAKHVNVQSYETLLEACFGFGGFIFMSVSMFVMSYGAMVGYLMVIKDTLSLLLGLSEDNQPMRRAVLVVVTMATVLPLSAQRDMADLAKTSRVSIVFYLCIVGFVLFCSPIESQVQSNGGWKETISSDIIEPMTFFSGFGVLIFAFVCQHSAFIIAGSLERPTKARWGKVTKLALSACAFLAVICGLCGYLGYRETTDGNILNNFEGNPLASVIRAVLCMAMFFVYPMDAFVSRHVLVVVLFKGRRAHEGDDHSVLARRDRRWLMTLAMYVSTLIPALLLSNLGSVLALTGAVAGSCIGFIGPGISYLGVHGEEFLKLLKTNWTWGNHALKRDLSIDIITEDDGSTVNDNDATTTPPNCFQNAIGMISWYVLCMPLWVLIARTGKKHTRKHFENELIKSPHPSRLGKIIHHNKKQNAAPSRGGTTLGGGGTLIAPDGALIHSSPHMDRANSLTGLDKPQQQNSNSTTTIPQSPRSLNYGAMEGGGNRAIAMALAQKNREGASTPTTVNDDDEEAEADPQQECPKTWDFVIAILFLVFGALALVAGVWSNINEGQATGSIKQASGDFEIDSRGTGLL